MESVRTLKVSNSLGLHARAAAKGVQLADRYAASLAFRKGTREVDGSSILSILTLSCPRGTEVEARAKGDDAPALLNALEELFEQRFGEER